MSIFEGDGKAAFAEAAALDLEFSELQPVSDEVFFVPSNIGLLNVGSSINSLGEIVINWKVSNSGSAPETFVVCCEFGGFFAPIGSVPAIPGIRNYRFVDHVLNAYVGKKTYSIVVVFVDGSTKAFNGIASSVKNTSVPRELYE